MGSELFGSVAKYDQDEVVSFKLILCTHLGQKILFYEYNIRSDPIIFFLKSIDLELSLTW